MNPQELYLKNGNPTGVWFCEKCRNVARTQQAAEACCTPAICQKCGASIEEKYWQYCNACLALNTKEKAAELFKKATKVPDTEYRDWVTDGDEGFWGDTAEYLESLDGGEPAPYLWACLPRRFVVVDTDQILEHIGEHSYDDFDACDIDGWEELKAAIAVFEEVNKDKVVYEADYTRAVLITKEGAE